MSKWKKSSVVPGVYVVPAPGGGVKAMAARHPKGWNWTRFSNGKVVKSGISNTLKSAKRASMGGPAEDARLLRSLSDWHNSQHSDEIGLPIVDPGNWEFKTNPFKMGVETMADMGASAFARDVVPGSYQPGGGWFERGEWQPGGGYWVRDDGTLRHVRKSRGRVPRDTLTHRIRQGGGIAGWPRSYDRFKLGAWPRAYDRFKMGLPPENIVGAATPSWVPGGGAYDKYTGEYIPGGGWNRTGRGSKYPPAAGWTHSSYFDDSLFPAPGVGFTPAFRRFAKAAKRRGMVARPRVARFAKLKPRSWMQLRRAQRGAAAKLLAKSRKGDPSAKAALAKIRMLANSGKGSARRLLKDIAQIAVCWNANVSGVGAWPREYDKFKLGAWPREYDKFKLGAWPREYDKFKLGAEIMAGLGR